MLELKGSECMRKFKWNWQATVVSLFVAAACLFMAGDWVYRNVPMQGYKVAVTAKEMFEEVRLYSPPAYDHLGSLMVPSLYVHDDGRENEFVLYVKKGSPFTLRYWQSLLPEEYWEYDQMPTRIIYTDYSYNEAWRCWRELRSLPRWDEFVYKSYRVTGGIEFDQDTGHYIGLIIEGEDADFVWEKLKEVYGGMVREAEYGTDFYRRMQLQPELAVYQYYIPLYQEPSYWYE